VAEVKRSRGRAPTTKREEISMTEAMTRLALSRKQVEREIESGMPSDRKKNGHIILYWPDARVWRDEQIRERTLKEKAAGGPADGKESRKRREEAEAQLAELEVVKVLKTWIPIDDAKKWYADACARVRARLLALPPRLAAVGVGHKSPREAQAALAPVIYEVMEELQKGDDVPLLEIEDEEELIDLEFAESGAAGDVAADSKGTPGANTG
jgi:hypothetical protein